MEYRVNRRTGDRISVLGVGTSGLPAAGAKEGAATLEMALEREGQIEYCDECEYVRVVDNTVFCGLSGKLLHPMMFLRGQGFGPARRCTKRKEAREMGLTAADLQRMGPEAQRQVMEKLGIVGKTKAPKYLSLIHI